MGKGEILNSLQADYIIGDKSLSTATQKSDQKFFILNNAVGRYREELKSMNQVETNVNNIRDLDSSYPLLNLPDFSNVFEGTNAKKFSKRIQSWKGIVLSCSDTTFTAKLYDLNIGGTFEIGEFDKEDISPDDLSLFSEGAIFYWSVGYYMENGQSVKRSDIRFQRLITLSYDDFEETNINLERKYSNLKERKIND